MATQTSLFFFLTILSASILNPIHVHGRSTKLAPTKKALFVFGDSLFDPGNNQYLPNATQGGPSMSFPFGETYFKHPTGRLSDGRIVPDFIAQLAKLSILGPYLEPGSHDFTNGTNFASGGAGVLEGTHPGTMSLGTQLGHLKDVKKLLIQNLGKAETQKLLGGAVYLFSMGGNDYFRYYSTNPNATQPQKRQFVATVLSNFTSVLKEVYTMGGRKMAFQNAGPLGCLPIKIKTTKNGGRVCDEGQSALARLHNMALARALKRMAEKLPGFKYAIFDYYNSLGDRVLNPAKYGFKQGTVACFNAGKGGTNPGDYVWFDGGHTTEKANWQLAKLIWNGAPNVTGPYNVMHLFSLP